MVSRPSKANGLAGPRGRIRRGGGCRGARRPFGKTELDAFKRRLLDKRRALVDDLEMIREENGAGRSLGSVGQHAPGDLADTSYSMATLESQAQLLEREVRLLKEIDDALERIEQGTYGLCLATGKAIGKARLRAIPWAKYCTEHARAREGNGAPPGRSRSDIAFAGRLWR